jgi:hypothetical protein
MCKEMPVILGNRQGDGPKKNNQKKWRAEEEERHKGSLTQKTIPNRGNVPKDLKITHWTKIYCMTVKYSNWTQIT